MANNYDNMYKEKLSKVFISILRIDKAFTNNKNRTRKDFEQGLIIDCVKKDVKKVFNKRSCILLFLCEKNIKYVIIFIIGEEYEE